MHSAFFCTWTRFVPCGSSLIPKGTVAYQNVPNFVPVLRRGSRLQLHTPGLLEAGYELLRRRSRRLSTNDLELHIPTFAVVFRLADFHVTLFYLRLECAGQ